jgi:hypothetical protein
LCVDHRVNGLGTCKHIEGVLAGLRTMGGSRAVKAAVAAGAPRVEVFLGRAGATDPAIAYPKAGPDPKARAFLAAFCRRNGALKTGLAIKALVAAAPSAPKSVRISRHFGTWLKRETRLAAREKAHCPEIAIPAGSDVLADRGNGHVTAPAHILIRFISGS